MRSAARALLCLLTLYAVFYAVMANVGPLSDYPRSSWRRCPVACTAALMPSTAPPLYVMTSSNLNEVSDAWVQYAFPESSVRYVYIGGLRVAELDAMSRLLSTRIPAAQRQQGMVVIGLWYGLFTPLPDQDKAPDSLDEILGMPLQATKMYVSGANDWLFNKRRRYIKRGGLPAIDPNILREITTPEQRQALAVTLRDTYRAVPQDGFDDMSRIVVRLREAGYKVLLVDVPQPKWHQASQAELIGQYRQRIAPVIAAARQQPGVAVLDLTAFDQDDDFRDHTHPTQAAAARWRDTMVAAITELRK